MKEGGLFKFPGRDCERYHSCQAERLYAQLVHSGTETPFQFLQAVVELCEQRFQAANGFCLLLDRAS